MISTTINNIVSTPAAGSNVAIAFPYSFTTNEDLEVVRLSSAGVRTVLVEGVDYTVTGAGNTAGGTVTITTVSTGDTIVIYRIVALTQTTDFVENDPFPADSHEQALDKLTRVDQQHGEHLTRTIAVQTGEPVPVVGTRENRKNKFPIWDSSGDYEEKDAAQLWALLPVPSGTVRGDGLLIIAQQSAIATTTPDAAGQFGVAMDGGSGNGAWWSYWIAKSTTTGDIKRALPGVYVWHEDGLANALAGNARHIVVSDSITLTAARTIPEVVTITVRDGSIINPDGNLLTFNGRLEASGRVFPRDLVGGDEVVGYFGGEPIQGHWFGLEGNTRSIASTAINDNTHGTRPNQWNMVNHGFETDDHVVLRSDISSGRYDIPQPLVLMKTYAIDKVDDDYFRIKEVGGAVVALTDVGSGNMWLAREVANELQTALDAILKYPEISGHHAAVELPRGVLHLDKPIRLNKTSPWQNPRLLGQGSNHTRLNFLCWGADFGYWDAAIHCGTNEKSGIFQYGNQIEKLKIVLWGAGNKKISAIRWSGQTEAGSWVRNVEIDNPSWEGISLTRTVGATAYDGTFSGDTFTIADHKFVAGDLVNNTKSTATSTATSHDFNDVNPDTITRSSGSFVSDGFLAGQTLTVANADTGANNGTYTIATVAALTITLDAGDALTTDTGDTNATVTATNSGLTAATYYIAHPVSRNSFQLATTLSEALKTSGGLRATPVAGDEGTLASLTFTTFNCEVSHIAIVAHPHPQIRGLFVSGAAYNTTAEYFTVNKYNSTRHPFNLCTSTTSITSTVITSTGHGLENGDAVRFHYIKDRDDYHADAQGNWNLTTHPQESTVGSNVSKVYYVVNKATDTFEISETVGGGAVTLTALTSGVELEWFRDKFDHGIDLGSGFYPRTRLSSLNIEDSDNAVYVAHEADIKHLGCNAGGTFVTLEGAHSAVRLWGTTSTNGDSTVPAIKDLQRGTWRGTGASTSSMNYFRGKYVTRGNRTDIPKINIDPLHFANDVLPQAWFTMRNWGDKNAIASGANLTYLSDSMGNAEDLEAPSSKEPSRQAYNWDGATRQYQALSFPNGAYVHGYLPDLRFPREFTVIAATFKRSATASTTPWWKIGYKNETTNIPHALVRCQDAGVIYMVADFGDTAGAGTISTSPYVPTDSGNTNSPTIYALRFTPAQRDFIVDGKHFAPETTALTSANLTDSYTVTQITGTLIKIATASTVFDVNDRVYFTHTVGQRLLPRELLDPELYVESVSATEITVSLTKGGSAITPTVITSSATDHAFNDVDPDTITRASGSFIADGFEAGMTINVSGADEAGNNGTFLVNSVAALTITLDAGETLTADASDTNAVITDASFKAVRVPRLYIGGDTTSGGGTNQWFELLYFDSALPISVISDYCRFLSDQYNLDSGLERGLWELH